MKQLVSYKKLPENLVLKDAVNKNVAFLHFYYFSRHNANSQILIFQKIQE